MFLSKGNKASVPDIPDDNSGKLVEAGPGHAAKLKRDKNELSRALADRNRWFFFSLILGLALFLTANGWRQADQRFADNVRVEWVKLDPSGGYTVEFYEENQKPDYFLATIDSKLFEWVERRFSKNNSTISEDYGFSYILMAPSLQNQFLNEYGAAKVAAEHEACSQCEEIEYKVRVIDHIDEIITGPSDDPNAIYHSIAYATETTRGKDGNLVGRTNKIINLTWRLKSKSEIVSDKHNLRYNPVGISIVRYSIKEDPNTLPLEIN